MKSLRRFASSILAAGLLAGSPAASFAADPPPIQPVAPGSQTLTDLPADDPRVRQATSAIERAPDPSAAVEAYAKAAALDSVPVKQAYVQRLIALGVPELAETQARDLVHRRPDDGLAWAVVAFMDARRDNTPVALEDIVLATARLPDDPFVQRTAAQILAYYDTRADRTKVNDALKQSVEATRKTLTAKPAFTEAYRASVDSYAQAPATPADPGVAAAPPTQPYAPASPPIVYDNSTYVTYTTPYAYDAYAPYPWWPSVWWWGPGFVIVDHNHFSHHHDDFHNHNHFDHHFDGFDHRFDHRFDHFNNHNSVSTPFHNNSNFRGTSPGVMRSLPPVRSTPPAHFAPARPAVPFHSSPGFSGSRMGSNRSFGSPMRGGMGGHFGGGGGAARGGGGGGHR